MNNQMNMMGGYPQQNPSGNGFKMSVPQNPQTKGLLIGFVISVVAMIIGCFLPYMTASLLGYSDSVNYVSNSGEMADGVFLIVLGIVAVVLAFASKYLGSLILQIINGAILALDFFNDMDKVSGSYGIAKWGIGLYVMALAIIASIVLAVMLRKKAKANAPAPMMQPMGFPQGAVNQTPQASVQPTCPYCGAQKTPGSFCPNCGAK